MIGAALLSFPTKISPFLSAAVLFASSTVGKLFLILPSVAVFPFLSGFAAGLIKFVIISAGSKESAGKPSAYLVIGSAFSSKGLEFVTHFYCKY
nr:MAG TPA: hypothetical protein [Caudoviricetes sp.]